MLKKTLPPLLMLVAAVAVSARPQEAPAKKVRLTYALAIPADFKGDRKAVTADVIRILRKRAELLAPVRVGIVEGPGEIIVVRISSGDPEVIKQGKELISRRGALTFREVADADVMKRFNEDGKIPDSFEVKSAKDHEVAERNIKDKVLVKVQPVINETDLKDVYTGPVTMNGQVALGIHFELTPSGSEHFDAAATRLFKERRSPANGMIAIMVDDVILVMPPIDTDHFGGKGVITGLKTDQEAKTIATLMKTGRLPLGTELREEVEESVAK